MAGESHRILHRKDETGVIVESRVFGPDEEVPEGFGPQEFQVVKAEVRTATLAESKLTPWEAPVVYQGLEDQPDDSLNDAVGEDAEVESATTAPPKGGPGSGAPAWAAYAEANDVEVPEDATRDEIVAALEAKGVPTD